MKVANIVSIKDVLKIYHMGQEKVPALQGVSLDIAEGAFCCLLGSSGSGKSTLLNMMAGLEKPTRGEIIIKGRHVEKMNEETLAIFRQKHVGFVFQAYNLLPTRTALENVEMPLIFKGKPRKLRRKMAAEMLTAVGLGERLHHRPSQMSGGQQQRVGIARAFVDSPEIIFADEPTGNLDTKTTDEVMRLITRIARDNHQTLILVTHEPEIAQYMDQVVTIRDGRVESVRCKETKGV
ncbi:MAG: ABC transporter ATP-binding protein [Gracilibacteraceae bacterium]|jgi:putative ABC transport system ATP-binding protein|nr:ABC transporter ATP-binding protein [Gracilibacteraceae bacterium]